MQYIVNGLVPSPRISKQRSCFCPLLYPYSFPSSSFFVDQQSILAMDGLSAAASIITVVELSTKVAELCVQYFLEVKDARDDISRLHREVVNLYMAVSEIHRVVKSPYGAKLSASQKSLDAIRDCFGQLNSLEAQLDPRCKGKAMSRFGWRALKWPFQSKDVDKIIGKLERCKGTISLTLQVDQTYVLYRF